MARGTRFLIGSEVRRLRRIERTLRTLAIAAGFDEVLLPSVEKMELYTAKRGPNTVNQMYIFADKGGRQLCLRPEGTATCQELASTVFRSRKDVRLFYVTRCWRYEKPQAGRYREFTQFGVEILNPSQNYWAELVALLRNMMFSALPEMAFKVHEQVTRGVGYYQGWGFEAEAGSLGAQKQVAGGGKFEEGIGFAIGLDRLALANKLVEEQQLGKPGEESDEQV